VWDVSVLLTYHRKLFATAKDFTAWVQVRTAELGAFSCLLVRRKYKFRQAVIFILNFLYGSGTKIPFQNNATIYDISTALS
jgi:hypothetical protein